jgi:hypothetical protein
MAQIGPFKRKVEGRSSFWGETRSASPVRGVGEILSCIPSIKQNVLRPLFGGEFGDVAAHNFLVRYPGQSNMHML